MNHINRPVAGLPARYVISISTLKCLLSPARPISTFSLAPVIAPYHQAQNRGNPEKLSQVTNEKLTTIGKEHNTRCDVPGDWHCQVEIKGGLARILRLFLAQVSRYPARSPEAC
jgi:hypothetical protein